MKLLPSRQIRRARDRRQCSGRAGISILELFGCLCAVVGGAWLGALYLGVDVRHVAYTALKESKLLDRVPEKWRPASPDVKQGAEAPTPEQLAQHVEHELIALRQEITALRTSRDSQATPNTTEETTSPKPPSNAGPSTKDLTVAYWARLNSVVHDEIELQADSESAATQGNATQVAALKSRVCRFASSAIQATSTEGVDPVAVEFGKQLANWYDHGGDLYDDAVRVWESPARGQDGHPLTEAWNESKAQHHNESRLLNERSAVVRESLVRRFGDDFPTFTKL